jgi:heme a synthase
MGIIADMTRGVHRTFILFCPGVMSRGVSFGMIDCMTQTPHKPLSIWLYTVCIFIGALVLIGGYTRLTRSGLSIVEWNVIMGVIPPIGQEAWEAEFAKYQASPQGQLINPNMTLEGYETIYAIEYFHRLIGRVAGLVYVLPLFYFLARGVIPWRKSAPYLTIGLGFAFQGFLGWYMVASGLEDQPRVSQYRLAAHLIAALSLLALTFWVALEQRVGSESRLPRERSEPAFGLVRAPAAGLMIVVLIQIAYGALVAGLKAGHMSNTWPLMFGQLIPPGLFAKLEPWWINLFASEITVHFIHRWFAFAVLGLSTWVYVQARKQGIAHHTTADVQKASLLVVILTLFQMTLGVLTVWFNVAIPLALIHQGMAMLLFLAVVFLNYRLFTLRPKEHVMDERRSLNESFEGIFPTQKERR